MENQWLVELTEQTVDEVDRILGLSTSDFIKEFAVETERVPNAKIEKTQSMIGTLRFFIKKSQGKDVAPVKKHKTEAEPNNE